MPSKPFGYDPTRELILDAIENGFGEGDEERLRVAVEGAPLEDLLDLLESFFDVPEFVAMVYQRFCHDGASWAKPLKEKLATSLTFAGHDEEADIVRESLR